MSALLPLVAYVFLVYNVSLVKFVLSEKTLHCWILTPVMKASHFFLICLYIALLVFPPLIGSYVLLWSSFFQLYMELSLCFSKSSFLKALFLPSASGTQNTHTNTHTLWLNTRFWSYLVKCVYQLQYTLSLCCKCPIFCWEIIWGICASGIRFPIWGAHRR